MHRPSRIAGGYEWASGVQAPYERAYTISWQPKSTIDGDVNNGYYNNYFDYFVFKFIWDNKQKAVTVLALDGNVHSLSSLIFA